MFWRLQHIPIFIMNLYAYSQMFTHGISYSPGTGNPWWRCCPRGPSGWRTVTSPDLEAAQTSSEPRAASRCLRAGWCCGRSLWSGIFMGARTLVANPCPYMPSMQTGNTQTHRAYVSDHNNCSPACVACLVFTHTPLPWLLMSSLYRGRPAPAGVRGSPSRSVTSSRPQNSWRWAGGSGRQHTLLMEIQLTKVGVEYVSILS